MTKEERQLLARRAMLRRAALVTGAEVVPTLSVDNPRLAEQKVPPEVLHYHLTGCAGCSGCALFIGGEHPRADGVCLLVAGVIAPKGICDAFSPLAARA